METERQRQSRTPPGQSDRGGDTRCMGAVQVRAQEGEESRRRVLSFSSEEPYQRWFGMEILDHADGAVDLDRLNSVGVLLYDGQEYQDIPIVLSDRKEEARRQLQSDHVQGLYRVSAVLYCARSDLGGNQPEQGARLSVNNREGGGGYFRSFYVAASGCEMGMLRVELEAIAQ